MGEATEYPIPVRQLTGAMALTIVCEKCHTEEVIDADDLITDDVYRCPRNPEDGPRVCEGSACMKYWQGDECRGCGRLGFWQPRSYPLAQCCSRRCALVAEHKDALAARDAA